MVAVADLFAGWFVARRWLALLALLGCGVMALATAQQRLGGNAGPTAAGAAATARPPDQLWKLPVTLRGPASATLGRADRAYWAEAMIANNPAQQFRTAFGADGVVLSSGIGSVGLAVSGYGRGSALRRIAGTAPEAAANTVRYTQPGVSYSYANGPLGLEQSFTVKRRPGGGRGALTVALDVRGASVTLAGGVVTLSTITGTSLRYGQLHAVDAHGRPLPARIVVAGRRILLRVDDRGAAYPVRIDPFIQQGDELTGSGEIGNGGFGWSVALSADGNTAVIGGLFDNSKAGAAWVFTRSDGTWTQQAELTGSGESGEGAFGTSVALSADGNTALIGGSSDDGNIGAAWVFTRSDGTWTQQAELTGSGESGEGAFGTSVALSADGNTALIGGSSDDGNIGAAWVFTRSDGTWTQQAELTGSGESGEGAFGTSVALSADGNTALIGGWRDNSFAGAAWVFTNNDGTWTQQGGKLTGGLYFGLSVALSADGNTALIGAAQTGTGGAAWVFIRSDDVWTQQAEVTGSDATSDSTFGASVALSADGNTALIGGPNDSTGSGAAWVFTRSDGTWTQQGSTLTGGGESAGGNFGSSVALSADGGSALIGGPYDSTDAGAAWAFASGAILDPSSVAFGDQTVSQPGSVQWITIDNSGQNDVTFTGAASIGGSDAGDFAIPSGDDLCVYRSLQPGYSCTIGVQFTPAAAGLRTATLTLGANDAVDVSAATVTLTGTGVSASSGPAGPQGLIGATGATGATGASGKVELVSCKQVTETVTKKVHGKRKRVKKTVQKCTTKLVTGTVKFTTTGAIRARLTRGATVYASGLAQRHGRRIRILLTSTPRKLRAGSYALRLAHRKTETIRLT